MNFAFTEFYEVRAPKESRGRLDQPRPWIAAPSGYLRLLLAAQQG